VGKVISVAEYLTKAIYLSGKTQKVIAEEVGWAKPNMISMVKSGITRVPDDKIPALAKAVGVDPAVLLRICFNEYNPALWAFIASVKGEILSDEERQLVTEYRMKNESVDNDEMEDA